MSRVRGAAPNVAPGLRVSDGSGLRVFRGEEAVTVFSSSNVVKRGGGRQALSLG